MGCWLVSKQPSFAGQKRRANVSRRQQSSPSGAQSQFPSYHRSCPMGIQSSEAQARRTYRDGAFPAFFSWKMAFCLQWHALYTEGGRGGAWALEKIHKGEE